MHFTMSVSLVKILLKSKGILPFLTTILVITSLLIVSQTTAPVTVLATGTTWYVAPSPTGTGLSGGNCLHPGFNTISAAITAASAGDTVTVCYGTYIEQVTISKSLTVKGSVTYNTPTPPIIQAPAVLTPDAFGFLNIVTITGATTVVSFSHFTVTGPGPGTCGSINTGIFVSAGATATITSNTIEHIRDQPLSGCQNGQGIFVGRTAFSTVGYATISGNTILDYQKGGIVVDNAGSTATITSNTVTGVGPTAAIAQNGIQISRGAVATVSSNTVSGNQCTDASASPPCGPDLLNDDQSVGILLYQSGSGTVVSKNAVSVNDIGIDLYQASSTTTVTLNKLTNNQYAGIALADGTYTASSNAVSGPGNVGIAAVADASNTSVTLSKNTISGVTASIGAFAGSGLTATVLSS